MTPANFSFMGALLKERSGLALGPGARSLVETRLLPIARQEGLADLDALARRLRGAPTESLVTRVVEAMMTNETFFFRDKVPFDNLVEAVLPALMARRPERRLRIWCSAASTGQEPYSIAMCIKELGARARGWSFEIVGTDLSEAALDKARRGSYSQFEVQRGLPVRLMLKYFVQTGGSWRIGPEIRAMVHYRSLNLLRDFSALGRFDLIFCRNVLTLFDPDAGADILARAARLMPEDGYLVLGTAETAVGASDDFVPVPGMRGFYRSARGAASAGRAAAPHLRLAAG